MLEVITGCMYSGKSEELIRRLKRCVIAGQRVLAFKPALDDRYATDGIATHPVVMEGVETPSESFRAVPVSDVRDLREHLSYPFSLSHQPVVGVDEVQFMDPEIIAVLEEQANEGRRVIVAGLDLDSNGEPFGPMAELLARADKVTKLTAVCVAQYEAHPCGKPATRSYRLPEASTGEQVQVGAEGVYEARCRACWVQGRAE
jgi:thymidine kinase